MITSHEALAADPADIPFLACMSAVMSSEFVGASELFLATHPSAVKWTLSRVRAEVRFQVTALAVFFIAAGVVASVYFLLLLRFSARVSAPGLLFWFHDQFTGLRGRVDIIIMSCNASSVLRGYIYRIFFPLCFLEVYAESGRCLRIQRLFRSV